VLLFSAVTVTALMATLALFPQRFLVSMGVGGVAVALVGAAVPLLVLASLLILTARRLGKAKPWRQSSRTVSSQPRRPRSPGPRRQGRERVRGQELIEDEPPTP
jgi:uncharacterized membrane protein YdfJ with MMPL/SSD domain